MIKLNKQAEQQHQQYLEQLQTNDLFRCQIDFTRGHLQKLDLQILKQSCRLDELTKQKQTQQEVSRGVTTRISEMRERSGKASEHKQVLRERLKDYETSRTKMIQELARTEEQIKRTTDSVDQQRKKAERKDQENEKQSLMIVQLEKRVQDAKHKCKETESAISFIQRKIQVRSS